LKHSNISKYVTLALLSAIIVVLQLLAGSLKIGPVSFTLVLIPIVVGSAFFGKGAGAILGGVFGIIVYIGCVNGTDFGGNILFNANPYLCLLICMVKGCMCGFCAGAVYARGMKVFSKKKFCPQLSVILAAVTAPVVNTGLFCLGMVLFYQDILTEWAAGENVLVYMLVGLTGINFLVELGINLVSAPAITTIIRAVKKSR